MTLGEAFRKVFAVWPEKLPRRGIAVNSLDESIPFKGFLLSNEFVALERTNPDALGARFILLPFDQITSLKFIDPLKTEDFQPWGFAGRLSQG